ncbi:secreted protein [Pseudoalteromonas luteoviolacea B = ATCC 29581]|nr:secreted protein [Pseudoalteromonas luteoviolacea B = ATCC 29581]
MKAVIAASFVLTSISAIARPAPLVSIPTHDAFFNHIAKLCGKAFEGKVSVDNQGPSNFVTAKLVMHVRRCNERELQIPFHVGSDASRTWILTKTGSGLSLKHDHRHEDGTDDVSTMYGGHTLDAGFDNVQSFPADQYSKELFVTNGIPQSMGNTWQMFVYEKTFTYRMVREGREFRVDFDLTAPITPPGAPWGYQD